MNTKSIFSLLACAMVPSLSAMAAVDVLHVEGWFESGYVTWTSTAPAHNVYVAPAGSEQYTQLDAPLLRQYPDCLRADAVGLKAGDYQFRIVPVVDGVEQLAEAIVSAPFSAAAHDRSGFAHVGMEQGLGAYQNDGTLKEGAKVLYVWADNAKSVSTQVKTGSKDSNITTCTGLQAILTAYQKGYDLTPLDIRLIGTIKDTDLDALGSSAEGLQVKGKGAYTEMPITIEGIGDDATISGFGILLRNCKGTELRNFGVMLCMDDCISIDTENTNLWIHNMDFFYGNTGGDSDQAKGDGTVDIKGHSKNITVSYNHFYDAGKCSLGGMSGEQTDAWHTYHHNWFDHSDSRHPRIRVQFFHIYNNYYDGVSKYGVGATSGGSAFVEANYFRNCKYPMLISKQGTDAEGDGTFSGEPGGVIKAFDNVILNERKIQYYDGQQTNGKWDAVLAQQRDENLTVTCLSGGTSYNNEADQAARTSYIEDKRDAAEQVPAIVRGALGAGRMNHGDFHWTFNNAVQDENYAVISALKTALQNYQSTLVGFADGTPVSHGGAAARVDGGDGKGIDQEVNDAYKPSWVTGGGVEPTGEVYIGTVKADGSYDYFWFNEANASVVNGYLEQGIITLDADSRFQPTASAPDYSDKVGSLQLAKGTGHATFYCPDGITSLEFYLVRTGSMKGSILLSEDGENFTEYTTYSGSKGVKELKVTLAQPSHYVRITNTATGSLHIQGAIVMGVKNGDDALETVRQLPASGQAYDLWGRRLGTRQSGLRIVGGKVVM